MLRLDDVVETVLTAKAARAAWIKAHKQQKPSRQVPVRAFTMPTRPPCAAPESTETTIITVYRKPESLRTWGRLYLRTDCLDWLLSYAADELYFQGVVPTVEPHVVPTGNCSEVDDLFLEWDFSAQSWEATFVAGTFANITRKLALTDINNDRWERLQKEFPTVCGFQTSNKLALKKTAKLLITNWCKAIVGNECKEFEDKWGLAVTNLETPEKKRKCDRPGEFPDAEIPAVADETAVADSSDEDEY